MAGPWDDYRTPAQAEPAAGPWADYAQAETPRQAEPQRPGAFERAARFTDNMVRQVARGATFGFMDEIAASLRTGSLGGANQGLWGNYDQALSEERGRDRQFEQENPIAALGGQIAGGVAAPLAAVKQAATLGGAVVRGALTGGAQGAATGFGEGEGGVGPRIDGATRGAAIGAGVGGAVPLALAGGAAVGRGVGRAVGIPSAATAERTILRDIDRAGMTPQEVATASREAGTAPVMLADVAGENVAQTAQTIARMPGAGRDMAAREIATRGGANQAERMSGRVRDLVSGDDFVQGVETVARRRAAQAAPAYDRAYAVTLPADPRLQRFLRDPDVMEGVQSGIASARREALADDVPFNLADLGVRVARNGSVQIQDGGTPTRLFDAAKRGLDEMIEASRGENGRATSRTRELVNLRDSMLREVDRLNPAFAEARAGYANQSALISAAQDGRRALSMRPEDFERGAQDIARMSPPEREFFRLGIARGLLDRVEGATDAQELTRLNRVFGTPAIRQRLRAAFDSADDFRRFAGEMQREIQMARTNANISPRGGSPTAPMQERMADLRSPPAGPISGAVVDRGLEPQPNLLRALAQGESPLAAPNILARRFFAARDDAALRRDMSQMAPYLFTTDPAARQKFADALVARQLQDQMIGRIAGPAVRGTARGGTTGAVLSTE